MQIKLIYSYFKFLSKVIKFVSLFLFQTNNITHVLVKKFVKGLQTRFGRGQMHCVGKIEADRDQRSQTFQEAHQVGGEATCF